MEFCLLDVFFVPIDRDLRAIPHLGVGWRHAWVDSYGGSAAQGGRCGRRRGGQQAPEGITRPADQIVPSFIGMVCFAL